MASPTTREAYMKPLPTKDKSAHIGDFFKQFEKLSSAIGLTLAAKGVLSFYLHYDDQELAASHPGVVRVPPPPIPVEPSADDPLYENKSKAFEMALKAYDRALTKRNTFDELTLLLVTSLLTYLPDDDTLCISAIDTSDSNPAASIKVTCKYLRSKYEALSETAQENLKYIVTCPLSLETSLDGNFSYMKSASATLTAKGVGFSENQLLQAACSKLLKNPRTKSLVEDYKKRDGYSSTAATFTVFSAWAVTQYDSRSVPDGTAAFAFRSDADYLISGPPSTPAKLADPVAAATVSPAGQITLTSAEIDAVMEARKKSQSKNGKQSIQTDTRVAPGWCILHGYGGHGPNFTSKKGAVMYCHKMTDKLGAPLPGYTLAQVTCTTPTGPPVDGMVRSQAVQRGYTKP